MDLNPAHGTALTMDGTNQGLTAKGFPETKALNYDFFVTLFGSSKISEQL